MKYLFTFLLLILSFSINAQQIGIVSLKDGSVIQVNADFTWQYVSSTTTPSSKTRTPVSTQSNNLQPAIEQPLNTIPPTQTSSTNKNGITINLINNEWDNKRLGLTFELTNDSEDNYVIVALEIDVFSDTGNLIKNTTVNVWQASFRLPDTYLRTNEVRQSRIIWIDGIDKEQWQKQLLNLTIKEMKSR